MCDRSFFRIFSVFLFAGWCACPAQGMAQKRHAKKDFVKRAERILVINEYPDYTPHHLNDVSQDSTLLMMIENALKLGQITAWNDQNLSKRLPANKIDSASEFFATEEDVEDPVTGEVVKVIRHRGLNTYNPGWKVLEEWKFTPSTGSTEVRIVAIGPIMNIWSEADYKEKYIVAWWVKYADIQELLARHTALHFQNSFPMHVWNSMQCEKCELKEGNQ